MLTIQLLIKNNESVVEKCLKSLPIKDVNFLIGDLGSTDDTLKICKKYTKNIISVSNFFDYSKARKHLLSLSETDWNFILNPWEVIFSEQDVFFDLKKRKKNLKATIIQGDTFFEEIRFVNKKNKFEFMNPVFETVEGDGELFPVYLASSGRQDLDYVLQILETWKNSNPLSVKPFYYLACANLNTNNWDNFLNYSNLYVLGENPSNMSKTMMHYYMSMVLSYIKKNYQESIKNLIYCIAKRPMMSEFWCLLGDIFYSANDCKKALIFYEAALIMGSQRLNHDGWPVEISKYKDYPEKMIDACKKTIDSSKTYVVENQ